MKISANRRELEEDFEKTETGYLLDKLSNFYSFSIDTTSSWSSSQAFTHVRLNRGPFIQARAEETSTFILASMEELKYLAMFLLNTEYMKYKFTHRLFIGGSHTFSSISHTFAVE